MSDFFKKNCYTNEISIDINCISLQKGDKQVNPSNFFK